MKKILFAIGSLSGGGAERVISVLANEFSNDGYSVEIACIFKKEVSYEVNPGIAIKFIESDCKFAPLRHVSKLLKIRNHINQTKPDMIISFLYDVNISMLLANAFNNIPIIISERNDPNNDPPSKKLRSIRDYFYKFASGIVFQTKDAEAYFENYVSCKSVIIGNPIKKDLPAPYTGERIKEIITATRLDEQKNIELLIDSFSEFSKNHKDFSLRIFGEGPKKNELVDRVQNLNLIDSVVFEGFNPNFHQSILKSAVFVLPSNYEGISNSMLEAMAIGMPVISTDCPIGGSRQYIQNRHNGILIGVNDRIALTESLNELAENKAFASFIAENAVEIRTTLDSKVIFEEWKLFANRVIEEYHGR